MSFLTSTLPLIIETIKAIEAAIPCEGKGEAKLAAVREILETVDDGFKTLGPQVVKIIVAIVKALNAAGVFKKAAT